MRILLIRIPDTGFLDHFIVMYVNFKSLLCFSFNYKKKAEPKTLSVQQSFFESLCMLCFMFELKKAASKPFPCYEVIFRTTLLKCT
jgi:hypothetical protein